MEQRSPDKMKLTSSILTIGFAVYVSFILANCDNQTTSVSPSPPSSRLTIARLGFDSPIKINAAGGRIVEFSTQDEECTVDIPLEDAVLHPSETGDYLYHNMQLFGPDGWTKLEAFVEKIKKDKELASTRDTDYRPLWTWLINVSRSRDSNTTISCPVPVLLYFDNRTKPNDKDRPVQLSVGQLVVTLEANQTGSLIFPSPLRDENTIVRLGERQIGKLERANEATYLVDTSGTRKYEYRRISYSKGGEDDGVTNVPTHHSLKPGYFQKLDGQITYFLRHAPDSITVEGGMGFENRSELTEITPLP